MPISGHPELEFLQQNLLLSKFSKVVNWEDCLYNFDECAVPMEWRLLVSFDSFKCPEAIVESVSIESVGIHIHASFMLL